MDALVALLRRLNQRIGDRHYEIGISFFLRETLAQELADIWQMEIEPYLEEYFFDQPEWVEEFRWVQIRHELGL
jgi:5-methylcytosine-specific restriction protein B